MASRASAICVLAFTCWITACSSSGCSTEFSGSPPSSFGGPVPGFMAPTSSDVSGFGGSGARSCTANDRCERGQACVDGICARSQTCDRVSFDGPVLCFGWADFTDPARWPYRLDGGLVPLQLAIDGGVLSLGSGNAFRCPEVDEFVVNLGGENLGLQPICGANPELAPDADTDAGYDGRPCCYGTIRVAGPSVR